MRFRKLDNEVHRDGVPALVRFDKDHHKITLVGRGDTAVSFTSIADIAGKHMMCLSQMDPY
jgi:hypothetical protein